MIVVYDKIGGKKGQYFLIDQIYKTVPTIVLTTNV